MEYTFSNYLITDIMIIILTYKNVSKRKIFEYSIKNKVRIDILKKKVFKYVSNTCIK